MRVLKVIGYVIVSLIMLILLYLVLFIGIFHRPGPVDRHHGFLGWPMYHKRTVYNICDYELPQGFTYRTYMEGPGEESTQRMGIQVFTRSNSPQIISFIKWPYHLKVNPTEVILEEKEMKETWFVNDQPIENYYETAFHESDVKEEFYRIYYYIPFIYNTDVPESDRSLILRGLKLTEKKEIETELARIWIWYGDFKRLAFDKKQTSWRKHYIVEAIHFFEPKSGAVALIQNKDPKTKSVYVDDIESNGELVGWEEIGDVPVDLQEATIFCLTAVPKGERFDQKAFEDFLKTVNFRAKVYSPFAKWRKEGVKFKVYER